MKSKRHICFLIGFGKLKNFSFLNIKHNYFLFLVEWLYKNTLLKLSLILLLDYGSWSLCDFEQTVIFAVKYKSGFI